MSKSEKRPASWVRMKKRDKSGESEGEYVDHTIIEINSKDLDVTVEKNMGSPRSNIEPPYWKSFKVSSYEDIKEATYDQQNYYLYLKKRVLNGRFVDIQGNTNYAFVLYFDFLSEYQNHRDIELLEKQFNLLDEICPEIKNYSFPSLQIQKQVRKERLSELNEDLEDPNNQFENSYTDYYTDYYKLGYQYKNKLGLTKQEVCWLNKFHNPTNVFLSIEACQVATVIQYITALKELEKYLEKNGTTLDEEITYFREKLRDRTLGKYTEWGYDYASYLEEQAESDIYSTMFKRVENYVREAYDHKRKISANFPHPNKDLSEKFETRVGNTLNKIILELKANIGKPNLKTQIVLNVLNVNRWKTEFKILKNNYKQEEQDKFVAGIMTIEEVNQKNPNIKNVFFEASKFIAKYDKVQSLKYCAQYIYYNFNSKKVTNKKFPKATQKLLFKTEKQLNDFKAIIVAHLVQTSDLQTALDKISTFYIPKRKKIQLDQSKIQEVEQKHEGTVELLNEYLTDDTANNIANGIPNKKGKTASEIKGNLEEDIETATIPPNENNSIFISEISMGQVQEKLVKMIVNNAYKIRQEVVEQYAVKNGMFKNQLIDSINEACEVHLDGEALIEEDDEHYIIEVSYYKEIAK